MCKTLQPVSSPFIANCLVFVQAHNNGDFFTASHTRSSSNCMSKECHATFGCYCDWFLPIIKNFAKKVKSKKTKHKTPIQSPNRILGDNSCYCSLWIKACRHPANMVNLEGYSAPNGMAIHAIVHGYPWIYSSEKSWTVDIFLFFFLNLSKEFVPMINFSMKEQKNYQLLLFNTFLWHSKFSVKIKKLYSGIIRILWVFVMHMLLSLFWTEWETSFLNWNLFNTSCL